MNKIIAWWKSIWANVKSPGDITEPDGTVVKANLLPDITIKDGGVNTTGQVSATKLTDNNGDIELK